MKAPFAFIAGSGGVLGAALMAGFAGAGYRVTGSRRHPATVDEIACDFEDPRAAEQAITALQERCGVPEVVVFNAGKLVISPFLELDPADFDRCWAAGARGAAACARAVLPGMLERGSGCLLFTGATGSLRGSAHFAAMAAGKFALRGLAQALAREYQGRGIHVVHVVLDGILQGSEAAARFGPREHLLDPAQVARSYVWLAAQPAGAWTHEIDLRPAGEKF